MLRGDRVREAREKLGLNQRDLARACGLAENMVYRYERGLNDITSNSLIQLAQKLGVSSDYLLGLTNNPSAQVDNGDLNSEEREILQKYRREGWPGLAHLMADHMAK